MSVAGWIVAAVIADPSAALVDVAGDAGCPSAAEVASALQGLLPPKEPEQPADRATLTDDGGAIVIALRRASGEPVGEKRLDAAQSCEQRARAAAVTIAAWEAQLGVQTNTLVVQPPAPPPGPAAIVARAQPIELPRPADGPFRARPGVGLGASINGASPAPAATVEVALSRPDGLLIPAVAALVVGSHSRSIGPGEGTWRRYGLLATVGSRTTWSTTWLEGRIGVAATLLDISGNSFPYGNGHGFTFDPGVPVGARFGLDARPMRWWIDATIAFWPRPQTLYLGNVPGSTTLPRAEALLSLGASYERR